MNSKSLLVPALVMLAACSPTAPQPPVSDLQVRLPAVTGNPGAAYFMLTGGEKGRTLVSITSPDAKRAEMHDMTMKNGMMSMAEIKGGVTIPAHGMLTFTPGGKHVMLIDMKPGLKTGSPVTLNFTFADGTTVKLTAPAGAPGSGGMHNH
jgi:copper(I)-binding protein